MPQVYRVMTVDGNGPLVADTARGLGVRIGGGTNTDIPVKTNNDVEPGTGGMSVAPAWRDLPLHRIPRRLGKEAPFATGSNDDACWRMGEGPFVQDDFAPGLVLMPDQLNHGCIEPKETMALTDYRGHLAATRDSWSIDEN